MSAATLLQGCVFALLLSHLASALPSLVMVGGAAGLPLERASLIVTSNKPFGRWRVVAEHLDACSAPDRSR
jgi:hypothetical protein